MPLTRYNYVIAMLEAIESPGEREHQVALQARIIQEWGPDSGKGPTFNALDLTESADGATAFNTFGPSGEFHVWNYPDLATSQAAFKAILSASEYATVVELLHSATATAEEIIAEWNKTNWGQCDPRLVEVARVSLGWYGSLIVPGEVTQPEPPAPVPNRPARGGDPIMHTAKYSGGGVYAVFGSRKMPLENEVNAATFAAANPEASNVSLTDAQLDSLTTVPWGQL